MHLDFLKRRVEAVQLTKNIVLYMNNERFCLDQHVGSLSMNAAFFFVQFVVCLAQFWT